MRRKMERAARRAVLSDDDDDDGAGASEGAAAGEGKGSKDGHAGRTEDSEEPEIDDEGSETEAEEDDHYSCSEEF